MIIMPAIDIRGGRVVRLLRGRPQDEVVYSPSPAAVASRFAGEGARWLHVVDLDAALHAGNNRSAVRRIIAATGARVQVGGGLRSLRSVEEMLGLGAERVVLGTRALTDLRFLNAVVERFGPAVVVAVDTDGDDVRVAGWTESAGPLEVVLARLTEAGAPRLLVTSIARDGTLEGPDLALYARLRSLTRHPLIASGGIRNVADIRALGAAGVEAAVVGKALYENDLAVGDAIGAAS